MGDKFWLPHPKLVWAPCERRSSTTFADEAGEVITEVQSATPAQVHASELECVEDICCLPNVSRAVLLHGVRLRYSRDLIYTHVSNILISVNPFKALAIYEEDSLRRYIQSVEKPAEAHVYGIGRAALQGLREPGRPSQAVLVSGESGAGKTEAVKLVLGYLSAATSKAESGRSLVRYRTNGDLASAQGDASAEKRGSRFLTDGGGGQRNIQDQIMQTNAILEAFGNAMTVRNNNSSRFGKWMEIPFDATGDMQGCRIVDYLLELTRVCSCDRKERTYHVFFALVESRSRDELKGFDIQPPEDYAYLKGRQLKAPGVDDAATFQELLDAFEALGVDEDTRRAIFSVVLGVLSLGNIDFKDNERDPEEGASVVTGGSGAFTKATALLAVDESTLTRALLVKKRKVGKEFVETRLKAREAKAGCDALARLVYGRLFKWLVEKINERLLKTTAVDQFLGLLDIAGFESFEKNSLEQLLINLSNEHLQSHFNDFFIKQELEILKSEGVTIPAGLFSEDEQDAIELIAGKAGILAKLDDSCGGMKASDDTFHSALDRELKDKHKRLIMPKVKKPIFTVEHFAGRVEYHVEGFIEKNLDRPPDEAADCLLTTTNVVLKEIAGVVQAHQAEANDGAAGGAKRKAKTVSNGFRTSLASLMAKVKEAQPHFVRCIKPNPEKKAGVFNSRSVMEQLSYSGVLEAVRIRREGYPTRIEFDKFVDFYDCVAGADRPKLSGPSAPSDPKERCKLLLGLFPEQFRPSAKELVLGTTRVFAMNDYSVRLDAECARIREEIEKQLRVLRDALHQACLSRSIPALQSALADAKACGLDDRDGTLQAALAEASEALAHEEGKEACRRRLAEASEAQDVAALKAALKEAQEVYSLPEQDLALPRKVLRDHVLNWVRKELAEAGRSLEKLRAAIAEAGVQGLPSEDAALVAAEAILREEEAKEQASAALDEAVSSMDILALEAAVRAGEAAGLTDSELQLGRKALAAAKRKVAAREGLAGAVRDGCAAALEAAIGEGEGAGLSEDELAGARGALEAERRRDEARRRVARAMEARGLEELREAVAEAAASGLGDADLLPARRALAEEEARAAARAGLEAATAAGSADALRGAIRAAEQAGVEEALVAAARGLLAAEERRQGAREALRQALDSRMPEDPEDALGEAEEGQRRAAARRLRDAVAGGLAAGLGAEELEEATRVAEREELRLEVQERLAAAVRGRRAAELAEAIRAAETNRVECRELSAARDALAEEQRKAAARSQLSEALDADAAEAAGSWELLVAAVRAGEAAGLAPEELAPARAQATKDQRRLAEAAERRQIPELIEAIRCAERSRAQCPELEVARRALEEEERKVAARAQLERAEGAVASTARSRRAGELEPLAAALRAGEQAGLSEEEMAGARAVAAREEQKQLALQQLEECREQLDPGALNEALRRCQELGVPWDELEGERQEFLARAGAAAEEALRGLAGVRDRAAPPELQLSLEAALHLARAPGLGGMDWKVTDGATVCTAETGARFSKLVESLWHSKTCSVLDELGGGLRWCRPRAGLPAASETVASGNLGYTQLLFTCHELREAVAAEAQEGRGALADMVAHPLALLCALLYTQQDVDIDRLMLFPDTPALQVLQGGAADPGDAYEAYRERLGHVGAPQRNPILFSEAAWAAGACCGALRPEPAGGPAGEAGGEGAPRAEPQAEQRLRSLVKWICLLSSLAARPLGEVRTVSRVLADAPKELLQELVRLKPGSEVFWPSPLSTTQDFDISERYATGTVSPVANNVLFTIGGVRQGLDLGLLSQYPGEEELLLPACSLLRVVAVRSQEGHPLRVDCEYAGTMLSDDLLRAAWDDLREASWDLTQRASQDLPAAKLQPPPPASPPGAGRAGPPGGGGPFVVATCANFRGLSRPQAAAPRACSPGSSGRPRPTAGCDEKSVQSLLATFEAMDRRGVYAVSREDFLWSQKALAVGHDFQRVARNASVTSHFFTSKADLTLSRFLHLSLPRASEADLGRALRSAARRLRRRRLAGRAGQPLMVPSPRAKPCW